MKNEILFHENHKIFSLIALFFRFGLNEDCMTPSFIADKLFFHFLEQNDYENKIT